jgi:hypothetical protein
MVNSPHTEPLIVVRVQKYKLAEAAVPRPVV